MTERTKTMLTWLAVCIMALSLFTSSAMLFMVSDALRKEKLTHKATMSMLMSCHDYSTPKREVPPSPNERKYNVYR